MDKRIYVYTLAHPDGSVFYVGKGTGNRINGHEAEARKGVASHKCHAIRKIWAEGGQIIKTKVAFFDHHEDAYKSEKAFIALYGRENLTNQNDGGEGNITGNRGLKRGKPRRSQIPQALRRVTLPDKIVTRLRAVQPNCNLNMLVDRLLRQFIIEQREKGKPDATQ